MAAYVIEVIETPRFDLVSLIPVCHLQSPPEKRLDERLPY